MIKISMINEAYCIYIKSCLEDSLGWPALRKLLRFAAVGERQ